MENEVKVASKPKTKKSTGPKTKIDPRTGMIIVEDKKKTTKKKEAASTKKGATSKTATAKKSTTTKKAAEKKKASTTVTKKSSTAKKTTTPKKAPTPKKVEPVDTMPIVEPIIVTTEPEVQDEVIINEDTFEQVVEEMPKAPKIDDIFVPSAPRKRGRKPSENPLPKMSSRQLTIEPPARQPKVDPKKEEKKAPKEPEVIVRPTPKKAKNFTKEEKVLYKKLEEAFNYVANFTNIIEERTMDIKQIPDLTIGELHVIEMVDQNNNKPMSLIAKNMKVTVGSLTISINRLVQKGYLIRTRHEMDHRIILISVTQKGKKVLKLHDQFHENILGLVLDSLTLKQTLTVMNQFAMVLENYYDPKTIVSATKKKGSN